MTSGAITQHCCFRFTHFPSKYTRDNILDSYNKIVTPNTCTVVPVTCLCLLFEISLTDVSADHCPLDKFSVEGHFLKCSQVL